MTDKTPEKKPEPVFSNPFANLTNPFAAPDEKPVEKPAEKPEHEDVPKPTKAEVAAEKKADEAKAEKAAERKAARALKAKREQRTEANPLLDAYDGQIAAAEAAGCRVIRIELSAAHWHELNDAAGVKDDKDTYDGIPIEIVGDAVMPTVVAVHEDTSLRQTYPVSIRGMIDPLSKR